MDAFSEVSGPANPLVSQPDAIRNGLQSFHNPMESSSPLHPVEVIQKTYHKNTARLHEQMLSRTYGSHFVDALNMERQALSMVRRGAGLPSSMLALEISLGCADKIGFEDYMNLPQHREKPVDIHREMEKRYDEMGW